MNSPQPDASATSPRSRPSDAPLWIALFFVLAGMVAVGYLAFFTRSSRQNTQTTPAGKVRLTSPVRPQSEDPTAQPSPVLPSPPATPKSSVAPPSTAAVRRLIPRGVLSGCSVPFARVALQAIPSRGIA